jgi:RimJ/RimL family protein N-acetyltransferase
MAAQQHGGKPRFTVYDTSTNEPEPIGVTTLVADDDVRTAEFIIMLAPHARGRGLGTQATRLTLDYAFHICNPRMVWSKVLAPNTAALHAYKNSGFQHADVLQQSGCWLGQVCDEVIIDALASDYSGQSAIKELIQLNPPAITD